MRKILCTVTLLAATFGFLPYTKSIALAQKTPVPQKDARTTGRQIAIAKGIAMSYPENWAPSGHDFRNAQELVTPPPKKEGTSEVLARLLVTTEKRLNHEEAVRRLAEIAASVHSKSAFLLICGWPALQRRYRAPLPQRENRNAEKHDEMALWQTTAVAAGELLVRLETTVAPGEDEQFATQAEAMAATMVCPYAKRSATELQLQKLRAGKYKKMPQPEARQNKAREPVEMRWAKSPEPGAIREALVTTGTGELEIGASETGLVEVIASNTGVSVSNNSGGSFVATPLTTFLPTNVGDPSVAVGRSGNIYVAYLDVPVGTAGTPVACTVNVFSSGNGGGSFSSAGTAAFCPSVSSPLCTPDQEHIAADTTNRSPQGGDQVYAVFRVFTGSATNCAALLSGNVTPMITCSTNSAGTFDQQTVIGQGDHPRVAVGADGFVYVTYLDNQSVMVQKFTPCANQGGLVSIGGFPVTVATLNLPTCPVAGLDRCDSQALASPTLAVDDTDPQRLYLAFAQSNVTRPGSPGDDVVVVDSRDGGLHWGTSQVVSSTTTAARRFMPWACTAGGTAFVSWYDRRAATTAANDLTDFFLGGARLQSGILTPIAERNQTGVSDPQCSLWGPQLVPGLLLTGPRQTDDSEACSTQPQNAGQCLGPPGVPSSGTACDFSSGTCRTGERCSTGLGVVKYGDYNGIACSGGRVFTAWASSAPPTGVTVTGPANIRIFNDTRILALPVLTLKTILAPVTDPGRFDLSVDQNVVVRSVGNGATVNVPGILSGTHSVRIAAATGTHLGNYTVHLGGDCAPNGSVEVYWGNSKTCTVQITHIAVITDDPCRQQCQLESRTCTEGHRQCFIALQRCRALCRRIDQ